MQVNQGLPSPPENLPEASLKSMQRTLQQRIKDQSALFRAAHELTQYSKNHLLTPVNPNPDQTTASANPVYITNWSRKKHLPNVIFKPGHEAAVKAKMCYGLLSLVPELVGSIAPSKAGKVKKLVGRKIDQPKDKNRYLLADMDTKVVVKGSGKEVVIKRKNDKELEVIAAKETFKLAPTDNEGVYTRITDKSRVSLDEFLNGETKEFEVVESEGKRELIPVGKYLDIFEHGGKEYTIYKDKRYLVNEDAKGNITFTPAKGEKLPKWMSQPFVRRDKEEDGGEDEEIELTEVLVPSSAVFPIEEESGYQISNKEFEDFGDFDEFNEDWGNLGTAVSGHKLLEEEEALDDIEESLEESFEESDVETESLGLPSKERELKIEGQSFKFEERGEKYVIHPRGNIDAEGERFVLISEEGKNWLYPADKVFSVVENTEGKFIQKDGAEFLVKTRGGKVDLLQVQEDVEGMIQVKIEDIFTGVVREGEKIELNTLENTPMREDFYQRIDMTSFINAFFSTLLLRPQDGKISELSGSNYLFRAIPDESGDYDPANPSTKLAPVLIDHDETMPPANDFSRDPKVTDNGTKQVMAMRLGLQGFPQAREPLFGEDLKHAIAVMDHVLAEEANMVKYLETTYLKKPGRKTQGILEKEHIESFKEVFTKIREFRNEIGEKEGWTLQDLCFHVFPEYKREWTEIGEMTPEYKALFIGLNSLKSIQEMAQHRNRL